MKFRILLFVFVLCVDATGVQADEKTKPKESLSDIYQRVFGKSEALPNDLEAELHVMGKNLGVVKMRTDGKHVTHVPGGILLPRLKAFLKDNLYQKVIKQAVDGEWVSSQLLKVADITVEYNTMELATEIKIGKKSLNRRMRSILSAAEGQGRIIPENLVEPAKFSGYTNLFSSFFHNPQANGDKLSTHLRLDSVFNFNGYVLENQYTYRPGAYSPLVRGHSRLVIDDVENEYRYRIGDIETRGRNLQSYMNLGGVQLVRDTTWANTREYQPQGNYQFRLEQDAEVDVYQDGELVRTVKLKAGEHQLADIHIGQGTETELRIKDDFGKVTKQTFSRFTDNRLLHPDFSRYAVSVGFPSYFEGNHLKYDTDKTIVSAYFQRGVTETLTAGVDAQTDGTAFQLGADAVWATRFGNMNAGVTHSRDHVGNSGQAIRFQINNPQVQLDKNRINPSNWSASIEHYSRYFQTFSAQELIAQPRSRELQASGSVSRRFSDTFSGSFSGSWAQYFDGNTSHSFGVSLNKRIGEHLSFYVSARQAQDVEGDNDRSIRFGLSLPLEKITSGRSQSLSASYQDNASRVSYRINKKGRYGVDSLTGSLRANSSDDDQSFNADVRMRGETFDGNASLSASQSAEQTQYRSSLNVNTAVVFADGVFARSSPVNDSFAIFEAPDGLEFPMAVKRGKSLFQRESNDLNNLPQRYDVTMSPGGQAVLSGLNSYHLQHVSTDSSVLPDGLDLNATEFDVLPDYKSGYYFRVGGERGISLRVSLRDAQGRRLVLEGGQLLPDKSTAQPPITFFTDQEGVMQLANIPIGRYRIELFSRSGKNNKFIRVSGEPGTIQTLELVIP